MDMLTKCFAAAFRFLHRPTAKVVAAEPDGAQHLVGTMNWLSPPSGVARSWEEALGGDSDAKRQQAMQAEQPLN
jgi:hypothetical protein